MLGRSKTTVWYKVTKRACELLICGQLVTHTFNWKRCRSAQIKFSYMCYLWEQIELVSHRLSRRAIFGCRLHQIAVSWSCSRAHRTRYGLRIEASSAKLFGNEFYVMGNDYFIAACSIIGASSKWSAHLITLCGVAPSTSATLCTASFKFSLTVHSSSLQFKYDVRSSIQFTVQFNLQFAV